jgi:hypothetical protein
MRRILPTVAGLAVGLFAGAALADDANTGTTDHQMNGPDTVFDLGIDITGVPHSLADVKGYLATLAPVTRDAVVHACATFMAYPSSAQEPETLAFCSIAVGG